MISSVATLANWLILIIIAFLFLVIGPLGVVKFLYVDGPLSFLEKRPAQEVLVSFELLSGDVRIPSKFSVERLSSVSLEEEATEFLTSCFLFSELFFAISAIVCLVFNSEEEVCLLKSTFREVLSLLACGVSSGWLIFSSILGTGTGTGLRYAEVFYILILVTII